MITIVPAQYRWMILAAALWAGSAGGMAAALGGHVREPERAAAGDSTSVGPIEQPAEIATQPAETATQPAVATTHADPGAEDEQETDFVLRLYAPAVGAPYPGTAITAPWARFWPDLGWPTLAWFAAVVILALTVRVRPACCLGNVDGWVLAGTCLLLALRESICTGIAGEHSLQWWAYIGLTAVAGYWILRGVGLVVAKKAGRLNETGGMAAALGGHAFVSSGTLMVLLAAGLAISVHQIANAPISAGSRDGIVGGLFAASSGKLPYGDVEEGAGRSPLLYLLHAGAVRVRPPTIPLGDEAIGHEMTWESREQWMAEPWCESADLAAARLVNALLFVALLAGVYRLGWRLHSPATGMIMVAILCVFPGATECLSRPDVMLPAALLTWTVALSLSPKLGGLLGTLCVILAGIAWPWAWLALPVLLAYFWRRPWQGFGSVVGLIVGVAVVGAGLLELVQPALPQAAGALARAGLQPTYDARLAPGHRVVIDRLSDQEEESESSACSRRLWHKLVTIDPTTLADSTGVATGFAPDLPNGVAPEAVMWRQIAPTKDVLPVLQPAYRTAVATLPPASRLLITLRTVLEATWLADAPCDAPATDAWTLWGGSPIKPWWVSVRRIVKFVVALLVVWGMFAIFFGGRTKPRHLIGALLAVTSASLIASASGAVTNLVWLLPMILALWAIREEPEPPAEAEPVAVPAPAAAPRPAFVPPPMPGPEPRITVQKRPWPQQTSDQSPTES